MENRRQKSKKASEVLSEAEILELITCGIGNCVLENNLIVCIINPRKLREYLKEHDNILTLNGIPDEYKEIAASYGYSIPVYYIIYNADFSNGLTIDSNDKSTISFEHCTFKDAISIKHAHDIRFYASEYHLSRQSAKTSFLETVNKVNRITFFMDNLITLNERTIIPGINIEAKEIVFDRSNIIVKSVELCTQQLTLSESTINANDVCLIADKIVTGPYKGKISAKHTVIDNENCDYYEMPNITGVFTYNGIDIDTNSNLPLSTIIKLQEQRNILVTRLSQVEMKVRRKALQKSVSDVIKSK